MTELDERIQQAEQRLKQLKARKQQLEARKRAAEAKKNRSDDTRRKILAGALVLDMMEKDEQARARFTARLDAYLTRPNDRALFGLGEPEESISSPVVEKPLPETVDSQEAV